jgi:hypothetical protein
MGRMDDERDLTKLWYLAAAIVRSPEAWAKVLETADKALTPPAAGRARPPSAPFKASVEALRSALQRSRPTTPADLRPVAEQLLNSQEVGAQDAARALSWAIETVPHERDAREMVG